MAVTEDSVLPQYNSITLILPVLLIVLVFVYCLPYAA